MEGRQALEKMMDQLIEPVPGCASKFHLLYSKVRTSWHLGYVSIKRTSFPYVKTRNESLHPLNGGRAIEE